MLGSSIGPQEDRRFACPLNFSDLAGRVEPCDLVLVAISGHDQQLVADGTEVGPLAARLRDLGVATETVTGEGTGIKRHVLGTSGLAIGAQCLAGRPSAEILEAARGLKG